MTRIRGSEMFKANGIKSIKTIMLGIEKIDSSVGSVPENSEPSLTVAHPF
jgi:hypothetical protein